MLNTFECATITESSKKSMKGIDFFPANLELKRMTSDFVLEWSNKNFLEYLQKLSVNATLGFMLASRNGFPKIGQKYRFIYA